MDDNIREEKEDRDIKRTCAHNIRFINKKAKGESPINSPNGHYWADDFFRYIVEHLFDKSPGNLRHYRVLLKARGIRVIPEVMKTVSHCLRVPLNHLQVFSSLRFLFFWRDRIMFIYGRRICRKTYVILVEILGNSCSGIWFYRIQFPSFRKKNISCM